jgi:hypothetical protein
MTSKEADPVAVERPVSPDRRQQPETPPVAMVPQQPDGEQGGPKGPEPTRFGDWEKNGRCFDF